MQSLSLRPKPNVFMPGSLKVVLLLVALVLAAYALFFIVCTLYRIIAAAGVSAKGQAFTTARLGPGVRVLVVGDSTGVGTGSVSPELSVAGRLAQYLGVSELVNLSQNGAKMAAVSEQLQTLPASDHFDLVLIQAGGNDIIRLTELDQLKKDTENLLRTAHERGTRVVFMSTGDVGTAPIFLPPLATLYDRRTRAARAIFMDVAEQEHVTYVDLFKEPKDEPFSKDPKRFYAPDGLHPTGDGYGIWFEQLKAKLPAF
jgi:lysophospholipase L1-like esterase